jgi:hypothetical protein
MRKKTYESYKNDGPKSIKWESKHSENVHAAITKIKELFESMGNFIHTSENAQIERYLYLDTCMYFNPTEYKNVLGASSVTKKKLSYSERQQIFYDQAKHYLNRFKKYKGDHAPVFHKIATYIAKIGKELESPREAEDKEMERHEDEKEYDAASAQRDQQHAAAGERDKQRLPKTHSKNRYGTRSTGRYDWDPDEYDRDYDYPDEARFYDNPDEDWDDEKTRIQRDAERRKRETGRLHL